MKDVRTGPSRIMPWEEVHEALRRMNASQDRNLVIERVDDPPCSGAAPGFRPYPDSGAPFRWLLGATPVPDAVPCSCPTTELVRYGCRCGGV